MKLTDYIHILNHPDTITSAQTQELEAVLENFPYLQSARAAYLKGLYSQDSYKYNSDLKITAAYTTDRSILFDFITSNTFKSITKTAIINKLQINDIELNEIEVVTQNSVPEIKNKPNNIENSILNSVLQSEKKHFQQSDFENELADIYYKKTMLQNNQNEVIEQTTTLTEVSIENIKPIEFNTNESHSFSKWLQLANMQPINRNNDVRESNSNLKEMESETERENKFKLIDQFIEKNPKIVPVKNAPITPINIEKSTQEKSYLMTETLAHVYLEQKKYQKAMQAYEILILKYPEKSSLFAERILEIKNIQNNN